MVRLLLDDWLSVEGDAKARVQEHVEVVRAVAHSDHLLAHKALRLTEALDEIALALPVDDRADDIAGQLVVDDLEHVGEGVVHTEVGLHLVGDLLEAARDNRELEAEALEHPDEALGAGRKHNRLAVDLLEDRVGKAGEVRAAVA